MSSEMQQFISYLANSRGLSEDKIIEAIKNSVRESAKKSAVLGYQNIEVDYHAKTGISCAARLVVVEKVEDPRTEISQEMARTQVPGAKKGDEILWKIDPAKFGRISASNAQQYLQNALNELEKKDVLTNFQGMEGQLLIGTVTRFDRTGIYVAFEKAEGLLSHKDCIPGEKFELNDTITVLLKALNKDKQGPCLQLTRTGPLFIQRLFEREVSEISDGTVVIKAIAREPGYRTKIAVATDEPKVDPIGACVGRRGMRVTTITGELGGAEKVDIIKWDPDLKTYVANALKPAELAQVEIDEAKRLLNVKVTNEMFSLAIGKKGQNSRLAARLLGWDIKIDRYVPEVTRELTMQEQIQLAVQNFVTTLAIPESLAQALVGTGYHSLDGLREATRDDLLAVEGMTAETADQILAALAPKAK
ncbi:MAG: transcription termination factor NusA [Victivallales bacterium]|nr:transcription termination factor NusA [Victivallales bacterium]